MSVGYNRGGGVIQRGVTAVVPSSSSSSATPAAPSVPRSYQPLVEEWALVTDEESDDVNVNEEEP